jgi:hypothetical protein
MIRRHRRLFSFTALATVLLFTSCLFDSREADPPVKGTGGSACVLDTPEQSFTCMTNALKNHNDADYQRTLSDDFVFSPTLTDSLDGTFTGSPVYVGWTKDVEMDVLRLMLSDAPDYTIVNFGSPTRIIDHNTFVRWNVSYSLRVVNAVAPTDTATYKGVAHIDVKNENGNWRVTFWDEVETVAGFSTWGFLRGTLRQRLNP